MTFFIEAKKDGRDASTTRAGAGRSARRSTMGGLGVDDFNHLPGRWPLWPNQFDLLLWKYAEGSDIPRCSVAESKQDPWH